MKHRAEQAISLFPYASVSKRVLVQTLLIKMSWVNELVRRTRFQMNGFASRLVLIQTQKATWKWPIDPFASFVCLAADHCLTATAWLTRPLIIPTLWFLEAWKSNRTKLARCLEPLSKMQPFQSKPGNYQTKKTCKSGPHNEIQFLVTQMG